MLEWFNGNTQAEQLYKDLCFICHIWDDLVDQDKVLSADEINRAFELALYHVPNNPFFQENREFLSPLIYTSMTNYKVANLLEKGKERKGVEIAHFLRFSLGDVFVAMIGLLNPREEVPLICSQMWKDGITDDVQTYMKEHGYETAQG